MTLRTHTVEKKNPKNNQEWSWEETPELLEAIKQLEISSNNVEALKYVPKRMHNGNKNHAQLKKDKQIFGSLFEFKFEGQESSKEDHQEGKEASRMVH